MNREIIEAIKTIEREKGIDSEILLIALEDALLAAYNKTSDAAEHARIEIDRESGQIHVFQLLPPEGEELKVLPQEEVEPPEGVDPEEWEQPPPEIDWDAYADEEIGIVDVTPDNFGRIAAQTAKQVVLQRIREAEREMMFDEYVDRVGEVVTGIIQQSDSRYTLVDLGRVEALLPESEQIRSERYDHGGRVKAVIVDVRGSNKGPQVVVSRRSNELVKELFKLEVPEMADGLIEVRGVAREPGWRSKIAVISHQQGVDPVGACVGPRGSRVRMVVSELRGEKIDIIPYNDEPARYVAKALSPARVREVIVDDDARQATVIVPDDQLSLAIGKEGMNARLAARLTGWRIDIKSESTFANEDAADGPDRGDGPVSSRCMATLRSGNRCPNAVERGTRYCSLDAHAAYSALETEIDRGLTPEELAWASGEGGADPLKAQIASGEPLPEPPAPEPEPEAPAGDEPEASDGDEPGATDAEAETPGDEAPAADEGEAPAADESGDEPEAEAPAADESGDEPEAEAPAADEADGSAEKPEETVEGDEPAPGEESPEESADADEAGA